MLSPLTIVSHPPLGLRHLNSPPPTPPLTVPVADRLIENVIGIGSVYTSPVQVCINSNITQIPIAVHSSSDVLSTRRVSEWSNTLAITGTATDSMMMGQIQLVSAACANVDPVLHSIQANKKELIDQANALIPRQVARGGGVRDIDLIRVESGMSVVQFTIDVLDAMGPNMINTVAEGLAPHIQKLLTDDWKTHVRILSNDASLRTVSLETVVDKSEFPNLDTAVQSRPLVSMEISRTMSRLVTGMSGDWRAQDAASALWFSGNPGLVVDEQGTQWRVRLRLPVVYGTVGRVHQFPVTRDELTRLQNPSARQLGMVFGAVAMVTGLDYLRRDLSIIGVGKLNWPGSPDPKPSELIKLRDKTVEERRAILNCPPLDTVGTPFLFAGLANVAALPIGVIPNVRLNGELRHLPYMVEEPSIGAAAANAAKDSECDATVTSLSDQYQIEATVTVKMKDEGEISKFMAAYLFADKVTKRAITNNKGFFNGTDPVLLAAGIDPSYIAYSAYQCVLDRGDCKPIVTWSRNSTGIEGRVGIAIPKASVQSSSFGHHSLAIRSIAGYQSVEDLVGAAITAGILNNKSAIKALAGKGINEGHMPLHNRSVLEH